MKRMTVAQTMKRLREYGASNPEHIGGDTYRCVGRWRTAHNMMACVCAAFDACDDDGDRIEPRLVSGTDHIGGTAEITIDLSPIFDTPKARAAK